MARRIPPSHLHGLGLRVASTVLAGALLAQTVHVPLAHAEVATPSAPTEPKRDPRFLSKEWRMAKFADFEKHATDGGQDAALNGATALFTTALSGGSLEDYGKAVVSAVADAYVPGLSKMLFQEEDPLAAQTQVLLDAIEHLEETMIRLDGDGWAEFRSAERNDIKTKLEAARDGIRTWNLIYGPNRGWSTAATLGLHTQIDRLSYVLNQIEIAVKTPGSVDGLAAYPYLSLIEVYAEVMQLYTLTLPNWVTRAEANDLGVVSSTSYEAAPDEEKQRIETRAREATLAVMEAAFDDALVFAAQISDLDPFRARANWMVSEAPKAGWFEDVECDEDTQLVRERAAYVLGPRIATLPYPDDLPDVVFTYKSNSMDTDYSTEQQKHCIVGVEGWGWWSSYDGLTGGYSSVADAVSTHRDGAYYQLLRTGWGPFAIVLDKWWKTLRDMGRRTGLRPALALDKRLGDYLLRTGGPGWNFPIAVSFTFSEPSTDRALNAQERVLFVDYALEYGPEALGRVWKAQRSEDAAFFRQDGYPLDDHIRFVRDIRTPSKAEGYYRSLFVARMLPIL